MGAKAGDSEVGAKCQSCGMPLKYDPEKGGTEADGSISSEYCSYCFKGGKFTAPSMTLDDMKALVVEKLVEKGFPRFIAKTFAVGTKNLRRWRQQ